MALGYIGARPPMTVEWFIPVGKRGWWRATGGRVFREATPEERAAADATNGCSRPVPLERARADAAAKAQREGPSEEHASEEHAEIEARLAAGESQAEVARDLGMSASTLSRKLRRWRRSAA